MPLVNRNKESNPYCVPAALSALTGLHVDVVIQLIKHELGNQPISGIFYPLALKILGKLGYGYKEVPLDFSNPNPLLLCMRGHVGILENKIYIDNKFPNGTPYFPSRKTVLKVFEVWKIPYV